MLLPHAVGKTKERESTRATGDTRESRFVVIGRRRDSRFTGLLCAKNLARDTQSVHVADDPYEPGIVLVNDRNGADSVLEHEVDGFDKIVRWTDRNHVRAHQP